MDPPPRPLTDRFRIRVAVFAPEDAHNLQATPKHTFVIAKNQNFQLQDLPLRELRDVVIRRYKDIYPNESLFEITKSTDSYGSDLFLNDRVGDIFADNEVLRVVKGTSIRDSLPPNYVNGRASSVQPGNQLHRKRAPATSNLGDTSRAGKRQKVYKPDEPLPSRERDLLSSDGDNVLPRNRTLEEVIPNSQGNVGEYANGDIEHDNHSEKSRPSFNQPSPVLGEEANYDVVGSDSQEKEPLPSKYTTNKSSTTTHNLQTRLELRSDAFPEEDLQGIAKATPKAGSNIANRLSSKKRERIEDISESEEHTPIAQLRGILDPYSDIETDLEQPHSIIKRRGRVTPLRQSGKPSPSSAKSSLVKYGKAIARGKPGSSSNNSTPKANTKLAPASTPLPAAKVNRDTIRPVEIVRNGSVSTNNSDDKSVESLDAGAEQIAIELSRLSANAYGKKPIVEIEQKNFRRVESENNVAEDAKEELAQNKTDASEKKRADAAIAAAAKRKIDAATRASSAALKREDERLTKERLAKEKAEKKVTEEANKKAKEDARKKAKEDEQKKTKEDAQKAKEIAENKAKAAETEAKIENQRALAEKIERQSVEGISRSEAERHESISKRRGEAKDKEDFDTGNARQKSTPSRSPGGMLSRAVAAFKSEPASINPSVNGHEMPPPTSVFGRLSTSPALTRKGSEDIKTTQPILPRQISSDIKLSSPTDSSSSTRRVSFADSTPSIAAKSLGKSSQSPAPMQTPKTVNGIQKPSSALRQSKIVPPGIGVKSVKSKAITPSSSQVPSSKQLINATQTPQGKANLTAALLNTINKGNSSTVQETVASKSNAITISSDEESDDESIGELELPPMPPSSIHPTPHTQSLTPAGVNGNDDPSNTSRSTSASTDRSQRESRSPVQFVNSSFHSRAASSTQSFDGSHRSQQFRPNGSETSEKSTSGDSESESEASGSDLSVTRAKPSATKLPSQSAASARIIPPPSRIPDLREGSTTPKPQSRGRNKDSIGSQGETSIQKLLDSQLTNETASSSAPTKELASMNTSSPSLSSIRVRNRHSITPIPVPKPKFTNGNRSNMGISPMSERPEGMAHFSSLRMISSEAREQKSKRQEAARKKGEAAAKALKDIDMMQVDGMASEEESEVESSSSSGSESDSKDESDEEDASSNDVGTGGTGTPVSASKAKKKTQKPTVAFSQLSKRFSLSQGLRR